MEGLPLNKGRFERLDHTVYGGDNLQVPLFVDRLKGLTDESNALLHTVDIIGGNPHLYNGDIYSLLERMSIVLEGNDQTDGILIEDSHGAGAVSVDREQTTVSKHGVGSWTVSTPLMFNMLNAWAEFGHEQ